MGVVGFAFSKMLVEKKKNITGRVNIKNNVQLREVEEAKLSTDSKKGALKFKFVYTCDYEPDSANVRLEGELLALDDTQKVKDILAQWKKDKQMDQEFMKPIMNNLLSKCSIQALLLAKEMNIPSPIRLPRISGSDEPENKPAKKK